MAKMDRRRVRENVDEELALTSDMLKIAQRLAVELGWRTSVRCIYYVAMRIIPSSGSKVLAAFLSETP